jgi:hypothetical protein
MDGRAAVAAMSLIGTFRTWHNVQLESVMRSKADIAPRLSAKCRYEIPGPIGASLIRADLRRFSARIAQTLGL